MKENKKAIYILNELLKKNYDAEFGYRSIMEETDDFSLRNILSQNANMKQNFSSALAEDIIDLGGKPVSESSTHIVTQSSEYRTAGII